MKRISFLLLFTLVFLSFNLKAQLDSLRLTNGDEIIGEVKSMDRGILAFETDYSDDDFTIEWEKVAYIATTTKFMITILGGEKYFTNIHSENDTLVRIETGEMVQLVSVNDIVNLDPYEDKFIERLSLEISVGYDVAQARHLQSFTSSSLFNYKAERWSTGASLNTLASRQDSTDDIKRIEGEYNFRYVIGNKWYAIPSLSALSNTEQNLDIRLNAQLGFGRYLFRTNSAYLGVQLGGNRNIEHYSSSDTENKQSWEGFGGLYLNLYDTGDLSLNLTSTAYPGITEKGRFRSDNSLSVKYDFYKDFFVKFSASFNYDNQPAEGAEQTDYVISTGLGWEL